MREITPDKPNKLETVSRREYYPGFSLKLKNIPEAKKWEIGKRYKLEVEVEMKSIREDEEESMVGFDVRKVEVIEKNVKNDFIKMVKGGE